MRVAMDPTERRIRTACLDVFDDPDDATARAALIALIPAVESPPTVGEDRRRIRLACQDPYDEPSDRIAQLHVLQLL